MKGIRWPEKTKGEKRRVRTTREEKKRESQRQKLNRRGRKGNRAEEHRVMAEPETK